MLRWRRPGGRRSALHLISGKAPAGGSEELRARSQGSPRTANKVSGTTLSGTHHLALFSRQPRRGPAIGRRKARARSASPSLPRGGGRGDTGSRRRTRLRWAGDGGDPGERGGRFGDSSPRGRFFPGTRAGVTRPSPHRSASWACFRFARRLARPAHRNRRARAGGRRGGAGPAPQPPGPRPCSRGRVRAQAQRPAARAGLPGRKAPLTLVSPRCQVCSRTMGTALSTGPRLALLSSRAGGAVPRWAPSEPARCSHSKPGPVRLVPLKKRGYDVTRNPHLNKVTVLQGRMAPAEILRRRPASWAWDGSSQAPFQRLNVFALQGLDLSRFGSPAPPHPHPSSA